MRYHCFLAVDCGWPQPLQNGSVIGEKTVYPNFVNHSCDEGFILRGSPKIKCQTNGTWSKTSSFCEGKSYQLFYDTVLLVCYQLKSNCHMAHTMQRKFVLSHIDGK